MLEAFILSTQLNQAPKIETTKIQPVIEQIIENKESPTIASIKNIRNKMPESISQKSNIELFDLSQPSSIEPIFLETEKDYCSGTKVTQVIDGVSNDFFVSAWHCLNNLPAQTQSLFRQHGRNLNTLESRKGFDDGSFVVPMNLINKYPNLIKVNSLKKLVNPRIQKLMTTLSTSTNCKVINNSELNYIRISGIDNMSNTSKGFLEGRAATIGKSGDSGSLLLRLGQERNKECIKIAGMLFGGNQSQINNSTFDKLSLPSGSLSVSTLTGFRNLNSIEGKKFGFINKYFSNKGISDMSKDQQLEAYTDPNKLIESTLSVE